MSQSDFDAIRRRYLDDCLGHTEQLLIEAQREEQQLPKEQPYEFTLLAYIRICNSFRAVRLLIMNGMGDDALVVSRSIVEESLLLHHMSVVSEADRLAHLVAYARRGIKDLLGILNPGSNWRPEDVQPTIEMLKRKSEELEEFVRTRNLKTKRVPDGTQLVNLYLRADMKLIWRMSQQMIHGSLAAQFFRLPDNDGPIVAWGPSAVNEMRETAALATFALATAHNAMAAMYGWPDMPDPVDLSLTVMELTD
jgi:hypothetical protein